MVFPNLKVAIFQVVYAAALELQFARKILCSRHYDFELRESHEILRMVCSNVNIGDLHLFLEFLLWNIDIYEFLFQAEYFLSKFGQSAEDSLLKTSVWWYGTLSYSSTLTHILAAILHM